MTRSRTGRLGYDESAPTTVSVTCILDDRAHQVLDTELAAGLAVPTGRYRALCGHTVSAAPMVTPDGQPCPSCAELREHPSRRRRSRLLRT